MFGELRNRNGKKWYHLVQFNSLFFVELQCFFCLNWCFTICTTPSRAWPRRPNCNTPPDWPDHPGPHVYMCNRVCVCGSVTLRCEMNSDAAATPSHPARRPKTKLRWELPLVRQRRERIGVQSPPSPAEEHRARSKSRSMWESLSPRRWNKEL